MKYKMETREWLVSTAAYIIISVSFAWLFYDSMAACLAFAPFFLLFIKAVKSYAANRKKEQLTDEFIRSLASVSTSLAAGISAENAFVMAGADMEKMYGAKSRIVNELNMINSRVRTGTRLNDALFDFAKRTGISEIYDFAVVFSVASENGADCSSVISNCTRIMEAKRQAETEARVLIRSKQYEQRVMCIILPGILAYLRISSGSFIDVLYHNPLGIMIMSMCLFVYVLAVYLAEKIGDVRL